MALTGELSDLSLAELIEFFCNQRKTGRLKVIYSIGPGYFYLQSGSVVHARIGDLRGIEAVYFSLTLPNASFTFSPAFEAPEHTINQPWTSVVLEGLRRMDEGVRPGEPFPEGIQAQVDEEPKAAEPLAPVPSVMAETTVESVPVLSHKTEEPPLEVVRVAELPEARAMFSHADVSPRFGSWRLAAVIAAVALIIGVIGVPWGWYARSKAARLANPTQAAPVENSEPATQPLTANETPALPAASESAAPATPAEAADLAAKRAREARARAKAEETTTAPLTAQSTPAPANPSVAKSQASPQSSTSAGSKKATVQVTYDENGRVTQASGGDATALRIARQKRFPAGKAGSATITIPIN